MLLFVVIGRANHHDGGSLGGLASTLWPFAAGTLIGLAAARFWRRPTAVLPTGVIVWLCTVAFGMILRVVAARAPRSPSSWWRWPSWASSSWAGGWPGTGCARPAAGPHGALGTPGARRRPRTAR